MWLIPSQTKLTQHVRDHWHCYFSLNLSLSLGLAKSVLLLWWFSYMCIIDGSSVALWTIAWFVIGHIVDFFLKQLCVAKRVERGSAFTFLYLKIVTVVLLSMIKMKFSCPVFLHGYNELKSKWPWDFKRKSTTPHLLNIILVPKSSSSISEEMLRTN